MRFLVDECTGPKVAGWLRGEGHEVFSAFDEARGMADADILEKAFIENWILITNDKDFGDMVFRERRLSTSPGDEAAVGFSAVDRFCAKIEPVKSKTTRNQINPNCFIDTPDKFL